MATENMVKAGRAGLTFGGDWDETVEYNRLVGVRYDNKLFFSKKPVPIGLIPEDGEYWFLAYEGLTDEQWEALLNGTQPVGNSAKLGGKDASEYALDADLANYLPLSGGKITSNNNRPLDLESTTNNSLLLRMFGKDGLMGSYGMTPTAPIYYDASGSSNTLLHTGNKPTGTYTGNGDATERVIETNGIGCAVYLKTSQRALFVTDRGAIGWKNTADATDIVKFNSSDIYVDSSGKIHTLGTSEFFNASGFTYTYQYL